VSIVFVTQECEGKNLLPASRYGNISILLERNTQVGFSAGQVTRQLDFRLSKFNDNDYLVLIGDPVIIGIAVAMACKWNQGRVNVLKWDKQERVYYPVSINLFEKGSDDVRPEFA
jgi:helix-turn-helix protein